MMKSVFLLQMLSKTSVDEVFMHHFDNVVSFWGEAHRLPPESCPCTLVGDFRPSDPLIAHPWKKS